MVHGSGGGKGRGDRSEMTELPPTDDGGVLQQDAPSIDGTSAHSLPVANSRKHGLRLAIVASIVVIIDQVTKHLAVVHLAGQPPQHVVWTLQWNLSYNKGMAFSTGQGLGPVIGAAAMVVIIFMATSIRRMGSTFAATVGGLIVGGATGNLLDRLFRGDAWLRGAVVDFIDFHQKHYLSITCFFFIRIQGLQTFHSFYAKWRSRII